MTVWYYKHNGRQLGPVSLTEIRILFNGGHLTPTTLVRSGLDNEWRSVSMALETEGGVPGLGVEHREQAAVLLNAPGPETVEHDAGETLASHAELDAQNYFYDRTKIIKSLILCIVLAIGLGVIGLWFQRTAAGVAYAAYAFAFLFGSGAFTWWRRLETRDPVLLMDAHGFQLASYSSDVIPWTAVRDAERRRSKQAESLVLTIDPDLTKTLRLTGMKGVLQRATGRSVGKATILLSFLRADSAAVVSRANRYLVAAHGGKASSPAQHERANAELAMSSRLERDRPMMTYLLMVVLTLIYVCEVTLGVDGGDHGAPSLATLFVFGGTMHDAVIVDHEWWRLFTAPFLHADVFHILFNLIALWLVGRQLEPLVGRRWFISLFLISALGGSLASIIINPHNLIGIGASGGIVGLFAALVVTSFRFPPGRIRTSLQISAARVLVPSLLPLIGAAKNGNQIDYASHMGGAVVGVIVMMGVLKLWPMPGALPRFRRATTLFSASYGVVLLLALFSILVTRNGLVEDPFRNFFAGRYEQAASIFLDKSKQGGDPAPYYRLWRYLAQIRAADPRAEPDLRSAFAAEPDAWPKPIANMLLHDAPADDVMAMAKNENQICEATFYAGELLLVQGRRDEARDHFAKALASCPKTYMEYDGARGELQLMAGIEPNAK